MSTIPGPHINITDAPVRGGVGDPPGLTHTPTGPGSARPRDSLTPCHAPGYPLTPPPGANSRPAAAAAAAAAAARRERASGGRVNGARRVWQVCTVQTWFLGVCWLLSPSLPFQDGSERCHPLPDRRLQTADRQPGVEPDPGTHRPPGGARGRPDPGTHSPHGRPGVPTHGESRVSPGGSPTPPRTGTSVILTLLD